MYLLGLIYTQKYTLHLELVGLICNDISNDRSDKGRYWYSPAASPVENQCLNSESCHKLTGSVMTMGS